MEQHQLTLVARPGDSLSSGALRLYALPYGGVDLYAYGPLNRRAAVAIVVASAYRRRGYALAMLQALATLARSTLHLHQLYADIAVSNAASLALFEKAGYSPCGTFRQWLLVGDSFVSSTRMQMIL